MKVSSSDSVFSQFDAGGGAADAEYRQFDQEERRGQGGFVNTAIINSSQSGA